MKIVSDTPDRLVMSAPPVATTIVGGMCLVAGIVALAIQHSVFALVAGGALIFAAALAAGRIRSITWTFDRSSQMLTIHRKTISGSRAEQISLEEFESVRLSESVYSDENGMVKMFHLDLVRPDHSIFRIDENPCDFPTSWMSKLLAAEKIRRFVDHA